MVNPKLDHRKLLMDASETDTDGCEWNSTETMVSSSPDWPGSRRKSLPTDGRTDGAEGKDEFRTTTVGLLEMWNPQERDKTSTQI